MNHQSINLCRQKRLIYAIIDVNTILWSDLLKAKEAKGVTFTLG